MSRLFAAVVVGLLFFSACTSSDGLTAKITGREALPIPQLADDGVESAAIVGSLATDTCPFAAPPGSTPQCHRLVVPSAWADRGSPELSVQVALFQATDRSAQDNGTVLWIEGGPGAGPLATLNTWFDTAFSSLNQSFDVVVFDPRGTGFSLPSLDCSEIDDLYDLEFGFDITDQVGAIGDCSARLAADGIDITNYDTLATARDLEALRRQLGIDQWNLVGQSYGTRLAQTYVREFPESVRAMVLDGAYSIDDDPADDSRHSVAALNRLLASCADDVRCNAEFWNIERRFGVMFQNLALNPLDVESVDPNTSETYNYLVDDVYFADLVFQSLYDTYVSSSWPRIIDDLEAGNTSTLDFLATHANNGVGTGNDVGVYYSVQCRDEWSFSHDKSDEFPSAFDESDEISADVWGLFCSSWGAGAAEPVEAYAVATDVPTLILGGEFDPVTPREGANELQVQLGAEFFEFPKVGHGTIGVLECADTVTTQFLTDLALEDVGCAQDHLTSNIFFDHPADSPLGDPAELTMFGTTIELRLPDWNSPGEPGDGYIIRDQRLSDFDGILIDIWNGGETSAETLDWYRDNYFTTEPSVVERRAAAQILTVLAAPTNDGVVAGIESFMYLAVIDVGEGVTVTISHFSRAENEDVIDRLIDIAESVKLVSR